MVKLNIGCGITNYAGYVRCDIEEDVKPDKCFDAQYDLWPFEDNSVEEVLAENLLEHFHTLDNFMAEAWRVLKSNGLLKVKVPHYQSYMAYFDPDHVRYFTPQSMIYWCRTCKGSDGRPVVRCEADFDIVNVNNFVSKEACKDFPILLSGKPCVESRYWNVFDYIVFTLKAVKPCRVFE